MRTVPWLAMLLDHYPPTHPHSWDTLDAIEYEGLCEVMPMDQWVKLDNELFTRPCDITACTEPAHGALQQYTDFDPADYLHEGNPNDWDQEVWTFYAKTCKVVNPETAHLLNDEVARRVSEGYEDPHNEPKQAIRAGRLSETLLRRNDEWEVEDWAIFKHYLEALEVLDSKDLEDVINSVGDNDDGPQAECNCNGPGSKNQKHPTHIPSCPVWQSGEFSKPAGQSAGPKKGDPCIDKCKGPGHPENPKNEDGTPKSSYNYHLSDCPQSEKFGTVAASTSTSTSYASCKHDRDAKPFTLRDGLSIKALAYRDCKYIDDEDSDIGVYMYGSWWGGDVKAVKLSRGLKVPWANKLKTKHEKLLTQQVVLDWPDYSVPGEDIPIVDIVLWMLEQLKAGKRLETACMGGHGRTGTMLALLLVAQGMPPGSAIARVRKHHCKKGIENTKQAEFVAEFWKMLYGNEDWKKVKSQRRLFNKEAGNGHKDKNTKKSKSTTPATGGGSHGYVNKVPPKPEPKWDNKLQLWICDRFIPGYERDEETKLYWSLKKEGKDPEWDEESKLWFRQGYFPGYTWNKDRRRYESADKNGTPGTGLVVVSPSTGKGV